MKSTIDDGGDRLPMNRDAMISGAFQDHATSIYRFIYAKLGSRAVAEDLTSLVFLKAVRLLGDGFSTQSIRSWLYTTARTALVDYWREQRQYQSVPMDDFMDMLFVGEDAGKEVGRTRERARRIL